jgi:hypothetical protein
VIAGGAKRKEFAAEAAPTKQGVASTKKGRSHKLGSL